MAYVLRNGVAIYYEVYGSGPAVLLTHGYAATGRMWSSQFETITRSRKLIVWDMRGHGRTDSPADPAAYTEAETVDDMAAVLDAAGERRAVVGGHSLGGFMSLAFHNARREQVAALMLCGTGPGYRRDDARAAWNVTAHRMGDVVEGGLAELRRFSVEIEPADHKSAMGLVLAARGMLTQHDARVIESLPSIEVPTFITVGSNDQGYLTGTQYLAAKIPGAEYHVFDNAGHAANVDQPDAFNAKLQHFLDTRVSPTGA